MSFRSGLVSIIGVPNVGKSTLLNRLAGEKVAIISRRPQTTRNAIRAVVTDKSWQIVFIDTPGLHTPRSKLGNYMMNAVKGALDGIDIVLYMVEAGKTYISKYEEFWLETIRKSETSSILVVNKIDVHPKEIILPTIETYSKKMEAKAAVPISALTDTGLNVLKSELINLLPEGPKYYPDDTLTDQVEKVIAAEIIREKALQFLKDEVPHGIGVTIEQFKERANSDILDISGNIICEKETHKTIIIGKQGAMIKKIGSLARYDMEKIFGNRVYLQLWVKVRPGWRNNPSILKELGYSN